MSSGKAQTSPDQVAGWSERDELQRLDLVAGVVAPISLAGCVASAALIATGHLVDLSTYALGAAAFVLLGSAVVAVFSLAVSPLDVRREGGSLEKAIESKRLRTNVALAGLAISIVLGFGSTGVLELIDSAGDEPEGKPDRSPAALRHQPLRSRATYT